MMLVMGGREFQALGCKRLVAYLYVAGAARKVDS
jgi:hypothetical protein